MAEGAHRAIWQAMRFGKPVTIDYLQEITGEPVRPITKYLNALMSNGLVHMAVPRQAESGETLATFLLARNAGPRAPYVDQFGQFINPNEISRMGYADKAQKVKAPHLSATIWVIARRKGCPFTVADMINAVNRPYSEKRIWLAISNLFRSGYVRRESRGVYSAVDLPEHMNRALAGLRDRADKGIVEDLTSIYDTIGHVLKSRQVGFLMDILRAEGYRVWVARNLSNGQRSVYRIAPPKSANNNRTGDMDEIA